MATPSPVPMPPVPLRLRLTLWYSAVLLIILMVFGAGVYSILVSSLLRQIDRNLTDTAHTVAQSVRVNLTLQGAVIRIPALGSLGLSNTYIQIWSPTGALYTQSDNIQPYLHEPMDAAALQQQTSTTRNVQIGRAHLRVFTVPVVVGDDTLVAYVQTGMGLDSVDTAQDALLNVLVLGSVLALGVAALVGGLTAGRALRPLDSITEAALQITRADDLARRIPIPANGPHDEVHRLALAFNESLERLEKLFTAQRRFLADVSHELRTPLTAIRGNVDLLRRMGGADSLSLDAIQSEAERMSRLVGDILLLAQAETSNLPLVKTPLELDTLLLEVFREAQVLAAGVHLGIGEIDQAPVLGDHDRLKQLLLNLVSNALKFTPAGGRVTLGLAQVNDWARLTVTDTGPGIPPEELGRIFERFYRVDKARARALGGAGLGLSIAQRIAHLHGGRIEAASEGVPGRGATFSVWLPLQLPKPPEPPPLPPTRPAWLMRKQ